MQCVSSPTGKVGAGRGLVPSPGNHNLGCVKLLGVTLIPQCPQSASVDLETRGYMSRTATLIAVYR